MDQHALPEHRGSDHDVGAIRMDLGMASNRPKPFVQRAERHRDVAVVPLHGREARGFGIVAVRVQHSRSRDGVGRKIEKEGSVMSQPGVTNGCNLRKRLPLAREDDSTAPLQRSANDPYLHVEG